MLKTILRRALLAWWLILIVIPMLIGLDYLMMKNSSLKESCKNAKDFADLLWNGVQINVN